MDIIRALNDDQVFRPFFKGRSWDAWRVFLAALFALPMTAEQLAIYRERTGRDTPPAEPVQEAVLICGRRSGKSFVLATIAVFLACFKDWRPFLQAGERATVMVIAADRRQARTVMRYIIGLLRGVPMLRPLIVNQLQEEASSGGGVLAPEPPNTRLPTVSSARLTRPEIGAFT